MFHDLKMCFKFDFWWQPNQMFPCKWVNSSELLKFSYICLTLFLVFSAHNHRCQRSSDGQVGCYCSQDNPARLVKCTVYAIVQWWWFNTMCESWRKYNYIIIWDCLDFLIAFMNHFALGFSIRYIFLQHLLMIVQASE